MIDRAAWEDYERQREAMRAAFRAEHQRDGATDDEKETAWQTFSERLTALRKQFGITAESHTTATEYRVSVFTEEDDPEGYIGLYSWALTVAYRGRGMWAVTDRINCLSKSGTWDYEIRPSERDDEWIAEHRFPLDQALEIATAVAPSVTVNGRSAAELKIELFMKGKIQ